MKFSIEIFSRRKGVYFPTFYESDDLEELKGLAGADTFEGWRIRIVDEQGTLRFAPPFRPRPGNPKECELAGVVDGRLIEACPPEKSMASMAKALAEERRRKGRS